MTDRELLELAAKAAGWSHWDRLAGDNILNVYDRDGRHAIFAPLTDDGDAFRLMVKLGINLRTITLPHAVYIEAYDGIHLSCMELLADVRKTVTVDTPDAATRRVIVRAAAEIGRTMK